jgi:hypothetical protein
MLSRQRSRLIPIESETCNCPCKEMQSIINNITVKKILITIGLWLINSNKSASPKSLLVFGYVTLVVVSIAGKNEYHEDYANTFIIRESTSFGLCREVLNT